MIKVTYDGVDIEDYITKEKRNYIEIGNLINKFNLIEKSIKEIISLYINSNRKNFINDLAIDESTSFSGNQNAANEYILFAGTDEYYMPIPYLNWNQDNDDGVVPKSDVELLNNSFQNSKLYYFDQDHADIANYNNVIKIIQGEIE